MKLKNLCSIQEQILSKKTSGTLPKEACSLGKEYGFTKRQSKVTAPSFIKALIVGSLNPHFSLEQFSKFITMMLFFLLCNPVRIHHAKDISFYKACSLFLFKSAFLTQAFSSLYRLKLFIADFFEDLALFALKETKTKLLANLFPGDGF